MSETQAAPQLSGQMFLFEQPELISKEHHGALGVSKPEKRFSFCAGVRAIPITVSEIPAAAKDYPIVFAAADQLIPLAVVGMIDNLNLFIDEAGEWEANRYIPGYIRRYPFGVAAETDGDRIAIVVDRAYEGLVDGGEAKLFDNEEPSTFTQQAIEFCKTYEEDRVRTNDFAARVKDLDVVKGQSAHFTPAGQTEPQTFAEYFGVDENVLKELSADKLVELRDSGVLPLLYAMLMSMGNWRMLLQRRATRFKLSDADILRPVIN